MTMDVGAHLVRRLDPNEGGVVLLGQHLTVWGKAGPVHGVVARRAIHLLKPDERNKVADFTDVCTNGASTPA